MKRIVYLGIALALLLALVPSVAKARSFDDPYKTDLIAGGGDGGGVDAGDVLVWDDGVYLYVKYVTEDGWCMTDIHLQVATSLDGIPQSNGNPVPGQFDIKDEFDSCIYEKTYSFPLSEYRSTELYIAAHAVVQKLLDPDLDAFVASLPDQVQMKVKYPYSGAPASFETTIIGDPLTGTYKGWCVDTGHMIANEVWYTANVYSSYETLPAGLVDYPENLDLVNWIYNQDIVGQTSPGGYGTYTYGDVQRAIWTLIEDNILSTGLFEWSPDRVDEIVGAAEANGEGFEPGCGDLVVVILQPVIGDDVTTVAQVTIVGVPLQCDEDKSETAWGAGDDFPGANWAMYITYTLGNLRTR
jgi:hypothetical protein